MRSNRTQHGAGAGGPGESELIRCPLERIASLSMRLAAAGRISLRPLAPPSLRAVLRAAAGSMAWRSHGFDNASLVNALRRNGVLKNERVATAMRAVDRGHYVPSYDRGAAYQDTPLPIGFDQTISAPHMHAACAELME